MSLMRTLFIVALIGLGFAGGVLLRPEINTQLPDAHLDQVVPARVGSWTYVPNAMEHVTALATETTSTDQPYDEVLMRTYVRPDGAAVMLTLAYGKNQRQEVKIHRPELCYPAQGMKVQALRPATFDGIQSEAAHGPITGKRMVAQGPSFNEVVSYWIRIGDSYSASAWQTRWNIMREGLKGRMTDGILVRVSQRVPMSDDPSRHYAVQEAFLKELVATLNPQGRELLAR
ncbi:EpsI family protein [Aquabacterium fontiphilum]|jgi:EpsI family protein|uniref:exosortase C-terminal domain/associated protein EpsI n=1 Tax=Aquabacterium fontiphilum TaxID=450365 RepID=UPI0013779D84|nr:exosortase C-terminal domain/associated protein EpsI [Aquabacterium fontiphilum]NBD20659.1 EpsI family protein [Aquabacterium fontiphilum]